MFPVQALVLLWKGVPFFAPPAGAGWRERVSKEAGNPPLPGGAAFAWRPARNWPWSEGAAAATQ